MPFTTTILSRISVRVGRTPTGVELWFNREFMACDLKIGIGCITPHVHVGFGGGAKIILPGVAGIETINQFHNQLYRDPSSDGLGEFREIISCGPNAMPPGMPWGSTSRWIAWSTAAARLPTFTPDPSGPPIPRGRRKEKSTMPFPIRRDYDLAVCNSYAKANESAISLYFSSLLLLKPKEGTAVLISDAPEGQVPHYVMRAWGSDYGGRHYNPRPKGFVRRLLRKLIVMAPYPDRTSLDLICHRR